MHSDCRTLVQRYGKSNDSIYLSPSLHFHTFAPFMGQKKLQRFAAIKSFSNVLEYPPHMAGNWHKHFRNAHPLTLELACGKGEYTVGLATLYPQRNCIGVDLKGNRLYIGAKKCAEQGLTNAAFLRTQIETIDQYFAPGEVEAIWITFPDPQLRISKAKKRLTHPRFLRLYERFLQPGGLIHLKTDSPVLYNFTKRVIELYGLRLVQAITNVNEQAEVSELLKIKTHYEGLDIAQSNTIYYLCFTLTGQLPDLDAQLQEITRNEEEIN